MKSRTMYLEMVLALSICAVSCKQYPPEQITDQSDSYSVVWKYTVKRENQTAFESEYGPRGTWYQLFNKSANYKGSFLHKSDEEDEAYLLIDTWTSKKAYESFVHENKSTYEKLSSQFEHLYVTEEKLGTFNSVK